ncbi:MAG: ABC transporter ATP-binding protein [Bacteroidales bacterium]|nr:ABC transporter ATP-binding protein [Bacteroidales bacterium]
MLNTNNILTCSDLTIGYKLSSGFTQQILTGINLAARKGEMIVLVGKNGSGKSTLLRTFAMLQPALGGSVMVQGKNINSYAKSEWARMLSYVSTEIVRVQNLRARELVALGRYPYTGWMGKLTEHDEDIVEEALTQVNAQYLSGKDITKISDGERQRVMIARAIAQDTPIILLDEPTAFLDLPNRYEIMRLLHRLAGDSGKTVLISSHDLSLALQVADKIWLIEEDKIFEGAPEDLIINGNFNKLFQNSELEFDVRTAEFTFKKKYNRQIFVSGDKNLCRITEKALNRIGIKVAGKAEQKDRILISQKGEEICWELTLGENFWTVYSIYDLSFRLKQYYFNQN